MVDKNDRAIIALNVEESLSQKLARNLAEHGGQLIMKGPRGAKVVQVGAEDEDVVAIDMVFDCDVSELDLVGSVSKALDLVGGRFIKRSFNEFHSQLMTEYGIPFWMKTLFRVLPGGLKSCMPDPLIAMEDKTLSVFQGWREAGRKTMKGVKGARNHLVSFELSMPAMKGMRTPEELEAELKRLEDEGQGWPRKKG